MLKMPCVMASPSSKRKYLRELQSSTTSFSSDDVTFLSTAPWEVKERSTWQENLHNIINQPKLYRFQNYNMPYKHEGDNIITVFSAP